jgi:O-6-methylguanine DNA methyltransferase
VKLTKGEVRAGPLLLTVELDKDGRLRGIKLPKRVPEGLDAAALTQAIQELGRYRLVFAGTPFFQKVWKRMHAIPWGGTMSYGDLAAAVGHPGASRAVGHACGTNRFPLIIPCHRVVARGGIGGFGYGLQWKQTLLDLEAGTERWQPWKT